MTTHTTHTGKRLYRKLTDKETKSDWYVDLPYDRLTHGRRVSEQEWLDHVNGLISTREDGTRVYSPPSLFGDHDIVVGTDAWKVLLRDIAMRLERRLFWERRPRRILYRVLTEKEKQSYWFVELPDDRPTAGERVSQQEWLDLVNRLIRIRKDGVRVHSSQSSLVSGEDILVGTDAWKESLTSFAMGLERRLFWEPRESVGLTEEGARRYGGQYVADAVRKVRRAKKKLLPPSANRPMIVA